MRQLALPLFSADEHPTGPHDHVLLPALSARPPAPRRRPVRPAPRRPRPGELTALTALLTTDDRLAQERFTAVRLGQTIPMDLDS